MGNFSLPLTQFIHENLSIVMDFCFSRLPLGALFRDQFQGEWKYLQKAVFDMSEQRANKAALELAMYMRLLDDRDDISGYLKKTSDWSFGNLIIEGKPDQPLRMREVANKIIHASSLDWNLANPEKPVLVCFSQEKEKWLRAEVDVVVLAEFCGGLMS
ncbi:MAG TPA: hypothetical protein VK466_09200 [Terriglobales bacterium]|nr:hypothetical protein [Terriglobales bacterium]